MNFHEKKALSFDRFMCDADAIHSYTGLKCHEMFPFVFDTLGSKVEFLNYSYQKPPPHMDPINWFFLTFVRLRRNNEYYVISIMFKISEKQFYNILITWIGFIKIQ